MPRVFEVKRFQYTLPAGITAQILQTGPKWVVGQSGTGAEELFSRHGRLTQNRKAALSGIADFLTPAGWTFESAQGQCMILR